MARVKSKNDVQLTKTESILLTTSIALALALVISFVIYLIVVLVGKTEEKTENKYENYVELNVTQFNQLISAQKSDSDDKYQDFLTVDTDDARQLYNMLVNGGSKSIYVLLYTTDTDSYKYEGDDKDYKKNINSQLEELVLKIKPDTRSNSVFLLFNYGTDTSWTDTLKKLTRADGTSWLSNYGNFGPYLLQIENEGISGLGETKYLEYYWWTANESKLGQKVLDKLKEIGENDK
jgi:hypothetical protein